MAKKGQLTKEKIVERAAGLFNSLGYYKASLSDVMQATGLEKGGIYNHFQSKDELAIAAFEYSIGLAGGRLRTGIESAKTPLERLFALIDGFDSLVQNPILPGGCPLLNCAVENDDGNPVLGERVRQALERLLKLTESLAQGAIDSGELASNQSSRQLAIFLVSSLEGGMMVSRLHNEPERMSLLCASLKEFLVPTQRN